MTSQSPSLREKLEPFRRRWLMMAAIVVAISGFTYYHFKGQSATYAATTTVFVPSSVPDPLLGTSVQTDPDRRLQNEAQLLRTPAVAADVAARLHTSGDPRELLSLVTVDASPNSDFLAITATTSDPKLSADVANGFADAFADLSAQQVGDDLIKAQAAIDKKLSELPSTPANAAVRDGLTKRLHALQISQATPPSGVERVARAVPPTSARGPRPARNAFFAAILGLVLAALLAYALHSLDRRLPQPLMAAEYGLPLLASIPFDRKAAPATRSGLRLPPAMMERLRDLRTMLDHGAGSGRQVRSILVTSAIPAEGKSTLVKGLALAYFESVRSVLVIDADLRRPTLHESFEAVLVPGLADVLRGAIALSDAVQEVRPADLEPAFDRGIVRSEALLALVSETDGGQVEQRHAGGVQAGHRIGEPVVHFLASGSATSDPAALLGSSQLGELLTKAKASYDVVLLDSPPILAASDGIPVAAAADAVVVVARSEFTTREAVTRCRHALEGVPDVTVLGVVANAVRDDGVARPYYVATGS